MLKVGFNQPVNTLTQNKNNKQQVTFGAWEQTLLGLKPDAFEKGLAKTLEKEIVNKTGLKVAKNWVGVPTREKMETHYAEHKGKGFFNDLIDYVTRGKFKVVTLEGEDAVSKLRTAALELRNKYAPGAKNENLIHSSDSVQSAKKEIINFFG